MSKITIQTKYFLIALVALGSAGIWLPICLEALITNDITTHNIPQNVTTYFIGILFAGCIDYFLGKLRSIDINGIASVFLNVIIIAILGLGLVVGAIVTNVYHWDKTSTVISLIGVIISYRIWWIANIDNPNFSQPNATLGGDSNKKLSNG